MKKLKTNEHSKKPSAAHGAEPPYISIIVPVYNTERYLRCCADSILAQTFTDFELLLIDDGSCDACPDICGEYAAKDARVRVIRRKNGGVSAARNTGLDAACGQYISFVDSDDWIEPGMYAALSGKAREHDADLVICGYSWQQKDGSWKDMPPFEYAKIMDRAEFLAEFPKMRTDKTFFMTVQAPWMRLIKRNLMPRPYFDEDIRYGEDYVYNLSVYGQVQKICFIPDCLYRYRYVAGSAGKNISLKRVQDKFAVIEQTKRFFDSYISKKDVGYFYRYERRQFSCLIVATVKAFARSGDTKLLQNLEAVREKITARIICTDIFSLKQTVPLLSIVCSATGAARFLRLCAAAAQKLCRFRSRQEDSGHKTAVFLLAGPDTVPTGGFKVVYEYANRFVQDGFDVYVVYPQMLYRDRRGSFVWKCARRIKNAAVFAAGKLTGNIKKVPGWFPLDPRVKKEYVWRLKHAKALRIRDARFVATVLQSSHELSRLHPEPARHNYYFVQGFESWGSDTAADVLTSYRLPLRKITIAPWLAEEIRRAGSEAAVIENGFDFEYFKMTAAIEDRCPYEIAMLYHESEVKRSCDGIAALELVKRSVPQLHVSMFGVFPKPDVPDWFTYYRKPDKELLNRIYNTAAVFAAPSRLEGMGLTPAESMICGCAVCCTDNPGFAVFAKHNETSLVSPALDIEALAENITKLIRDRELRIRLASAGHMYIRQFTWERAYKKFKEELYGTDF